ncbi:MAG: glycosyltransferase family 4 protein [Pseudomonadota bacterium]
MSVLFCHDHRFVRAPDGRIFSTGQYDKSVVARYEEIFGEVWIAGRDRMAAADEDFSRLSLVLDGPERFVGVSDLSSIKGLLNGPGVAAPLLAPALEQVDAVIARLPSEIGLAALTLAQRRGMTSAVEVVACVWDGLRGHGAKLASLYAPLALSRMKRAVARADHAIYVSQEFLQKRYPPKPGAHVAGVSDVQLPEPDEALLDARLDGIRKAGDAAPTLGMLAALFHRSKGVDIAMKALAEARKTVPGLTMEVVGPGDVAPWLEEARALGLSDAVTFKGALPRGEAVLKWLDTIDVYVQASFQEGLPRGLIEAMSRAAPALASDAGGTAELVDPAALHTPGDHGTLARQMATALAPDDRIAAAQRNFRKAAEFASEKLDARRRMFWNKVKEEADAGRLRG